MTANRDTLHEAWDRHARETLDSYLVQGIENPGLNPQSVLIRALLIDSLFPGRFDDLIGRELFYSACAATVWLGHQEQWIPFLLNELHQPTPGAIFQVPRFLLPAANPPFDIESAVSNINQAFTSSFDRFASPFEAEWQEALANLTTPSVSVLELACGSANDARDFPRYGLARFLNYTGVDIATRNIENARHHFPGGAFVTGDSRALNFADQSFDFVFMCDLLEHLPPGGLAQTLSEAARVTKKELWISLFNADWIPLHEYRKTDLYHWNRLSLDEIRQSLEEAGFGSYAIDIPAEWPNRFPGYRHYNPHARIVVAKRKPE